MRRATDKVEFKRLVEAGFTVKPDVMWNYTMRTDKPNPYLSDYCETTEKSSTMFICPAWSLSLLMESVPKITDLGYFAIIYNPHIKRYYAGYQGEEGIFRIVYGAVDLIGAIVDLLLFTLKLTDMVDIGQKFTEWCRSHQDIFDKMAEVDSRPKCMYNPADRQEGAPSTDDLHVSQLPKYHKNNG